MPFADYFRSMLASGWLEVIEQLLSVLHQSFFSLPARTYQFTDLYDLTHYQTSQHSTSLKLPFPGDVMEIVLDFLYSGQPGKVKGEYFTHALYMQFLLLMLLGSIAGVRMTKHPSLAGFGI